MKKLGAVTVLVLFLCVISGCGAKEDSVDNVEPETGNIEEKNNDQEETSEDQSLEVEKNLFSVEITIPSDYAGDLSEFNEETYLKDNPGVNEAKVLEDGSLALKMTKKKHNELVKETKENFEEAFKELVEDEEAPYLKKITWSDELEDFTMVVHGEVWENSMDFTPISLALSAAMYQSIQGKDFYTVIKIVDEESNELLHEAVFPDDFNE